MATKLHDPILRAAVRMFARQGYHGTSTKDLAAAANVNESSIFRLFGSKEELFRAAIRQEAMKRISPADFARHLSHPDLATAVRGAANALVATLTPAYGRLLMFGTLEKPEIAHPLLAERLVPLTGLVADRLRRAVRDGQARRGTDGKAQGRVLIYSLYAHVLFRDTIVPRESRPELAEVMAYVNSWLKGVLLS